MARALEPHGVQVSVATTDDDGPGRHMTGLELATAIPQEGGWTARYFPKQTEFYKVSLPLWRWLHEHAREYDLVHVHALFSFASLTAMRAARRQGVPYIVRPLGVLNRWGMEQRRRWVKNFSFRLLELPLLRRAAAMHYTSRMEQEDASRFGLRNHQAVIPIGMNLSPFETLPSRDVFTRQFPATATTRNILFLSRIDVKKGVDLLLSAFTKIAAQHPMAHLIICGSGDPALVTALQQQAAALGIANRVTWTGFVTGELRLAAYATAEMFVLPSHSENFGIALLEAMAAGLPCLSTNQVALAVDAATSGAVHIAAREANSFAQAMSNLLNSASQQQSLAQAARTLARSDYSLAAMGRSLHQLYQELVPSTVTSV